MKPPRCMARSYDDRGALLVIAMIVVTVVALVTGFVLTRGDGSLRATVALRDVARSSYAADSAAQVAINALRTGYNTGSGEPTPWYYTNVAATGCFGYNGTPPTSAPLNSLVLNNLIPANPGETQQAMSARVECAPDDDTGEQGSAVPINNQNKPGYAIVTLNGAVDATGTKDPGLLVKGGIYANGAVKGDVEVIEGGVRATGACDSTVVATPKNCNVGTPISDPNYAHELGSTVPALQKPPTSCTGGYLAVFEPGYYDSASALNAATNLCSELWFKPGNYYFDFHDESCANVCPDNVYAGSSNVWTISGQTVIGGTPIDVDGNTLARPPSGASIPGACRSPITDVNAQGVQFVFGGNSRIYIDQNSHVELCATYHADRPPIEIYGLKSGSTPSSANANGLTATDPVTSSGQGTWTGLTAANIAAAGGGSATWAPGAAASRTTTVQATGFTPATALPAGSILTGATLRVTHQDADATTASAASATLKVGATTSASLSLADGTGKGYATMTTSSVTFNSTTNAGVFNALQTAVHDGTYTGATVSYTAKSIVNKSSILDGIALDLTYYVPVLRGQGGTCIDGTGGGCRFMDMKNGNNKEVVYFQGTTYVPYGDLQLLLGNFASEIMKFGLVARQLEFAFWNGASVQGVPVIEIPDNSPGFGFETTLVKLKVYVCPGTTCNSGGELALNTKVRIFDDGGTPGPPNRQMTVLSWSHTR